MKTFETKKQAGKKSVYNPAPVKCVHRIHVRCTYEKAQIQLRIIYCINVYTITSGFHHIYKVSRTTLFDIVCIVSYMYMCKKMHVTTIIIIYVLQLYAKRTHLFCLLHARCYHTHSLPAFVCVMPLCRVGTQANCHHLARTV